jgi:hypothetical protein
MNQNDAINPDNLFADIGTPPQPLTAEEGTQVAQQAQNALAVKTERVTTVLDSQQTSIDLAKTTVEQRIAAIQANQGSFDLQKVVNGWFTVAEANNAASMVLTRKETQLNIETAASYGTVPDNVVSQFVNSAATKETGEARLEVAKVLDTATGITRKIAEDKSISADEVSKKAQKLLKVWTNAKILEALFDRLFKQTVNRVVDYQTRLGSVGQDLAKKQVTLESVSSSLVARQTLVKSCLYNTCISGMALVSILEREKARLADLEAKKNEDQETPPQVYAQKIQEQEALMEIITKRLVDEKAFAIKLIGLYSVLGNTRFNVAVIKADVVFTRTNLMATLGLQLGLVVDIISTLRISKAAVDIRNAEADAAEKVGVSSAALSEAGNQALVNIDTTIRSLNATISAAVAGIKNTHDNIQRVADMATKADEDFGNMFATLAE